jgi:hypothetical protein
MLRQELFTKPRPYDTKFRRNIAKFRESVQLFREISRNFAVRNFVDHPSVKYLILLWRDFLFKCENGRNGKSKEDEGT